MFVTNTTCNTITAITTTSVCVSSVSCLTVKYRLIHSSIKGSKASGPTYQMALGCPSETRVPAPCWRFPVGESVESQLPSFSAFGGYMLASVFFYGELGRSSSCFIASVWTPGITNFTALKCSLCPSNCTWREETPAGLCTAPAQRLPGLFKSDVSGSFRVNRLQFVSMT